MDRAKDPTWQRRFDASPTDLQRVMSMIVHVERVLAELEAKGSSVGELLPHIRILHGLQDRESELLGSLPRAWRKHAPRPATRRSQIT